MSHHPDRRGATLLQCAELAATAGDGPFAPPQPGSADARIDLKLLIHRARRAAGSDHRAAARLADFAAERRPDLWAGTVQDGTARGFAAALEEAASLLPEDPRAGPPEAVLARLPLDPLRGAEIAGKELRRRKDLLVASAGPRVRFARKTGLLLVDRDRQLESAAFVRFEDRSDRGTLDGFVPDPGERARLFDARFLQPVRHRQGADLDALLLAGRLGRGPNGFACRLAVLGFHDEPFLRLQLAVENRLTDHRLRVRFLGLPPGYVTHACTDVAERVDAPAGAFDAFTLVRACGRLLVDGGEVAVPAAQCQGTLVHEFRLGATASAR